MTSISRKFYYIMFYAEARNTASPALHANQQAVLMNATQHGSTMSNMTPPGIVNAQQLNATQHGSSLSNTTPSGMMNAQQLNIPTTTAANANITGAGENIPPVNDVSMTTSEGPSSIPTTLVTSTPIAGNANLSLQSSIVHTPGSNMSRSQGVHQPQSYNAGYETFRGRGRGRARGRPEARGRMFTVMVCRAHDMMFCQRCVTYVSSYTYWARHPELPPLEE